MGASETIFNSEALSAHYRAGSSPWTLVMFESAALVGKRVDPPRRRFIESADLSAVIIAAHRRHWYPRADMTPCIAAVRAALPDAPVVTHGASMGGYGAIKYAAALGASHTVALAPQFSIDPTVIRLKSDPFVINFRPELHAGMEIARGDATGTVDVIFDPHQENDREHVDLIGRRIQCRTTYAHHAGHALDAVLGTGDALAAIIRACMADDRAAVAAHIRLLKRSSVYFHMGLHHALLDTRPRLAKWALGRALALTPVGADDRAKRAEAQVLAGQAHVATAELQDAIARTRSLSTTSRLAGALIGAMSAMGRVEEAVHWARQQVAHAADDEATWVHLAAALIRGLHYDEAERILADLVARFDLPGAHFRLGEICAEQRRTDEALVHGFRAVTLAPANHGWRAFVARLLENRGREAEAEALLFGAVRTIGDAGSWLEWSRHLQSKGRTREALEAARRGVRLRPANMTMRHHLALLLVGNGDGEEALALSHESVERLHGGSLALSQRARVLQRLSRLPEAIALMRQAVALDPGNPGYRAVLIDMLLQADDVEGAGQAVEEADAAPCGVTSTLLAARARLTMRRGDTDEALKLAREASALSPANADLQGSLARLLLQGGQLQEAERLVRDALILQPRADWLRGLLFTSLERQGKTEAAIEAVRDAIAKGSRAPAFRTKLVDLLLVAGRDTEAAGVIAQALDEGLETEGLHVAQGRLFARNGAIDAAIQAQRRALALAPDSAGHRGTLAQYLLQAGQVDEAEHFARSAVALQPKAPWLHRLFVTTLERQAHSEAALNALRDAIVAHPAVPDFRSRLAMGLLAIGRRQDGIDVISDALNGGMETAEIRTVEARLHAQRGDWDGAIGAAQRAITLSPGQAGLHGALGQYFIQAGRPAEAETQARAALALQPRVAWLSRLLTTALERQGKPDNPDHSVVPG